MHNKRRLILILLLTTIPLAQTFSTDMPAAKAIEKTKMSNSRPNCLKTLMKASSFDDGMRGESPHPSENYVAYQQASAMLNELTIDDLNIVMSQGSPAGRLYAAVLLTEQGRVGKNLTFEKLLNDNAKVEYHSGCKGTSSTVGEIARSLNDTGKYLNFAYSQFCKYKTPIIDKEKAFQVLQNASVLVDFQQGDTNKPSPIWQAFQTLLSEGKAANSEAQALFKSQSAAARLYGAILLKQMDPDASKAKLQSLLNDDAQVVRSQGCSREQSSVKEFAERILRGEQLVKLKDPSKL